MSPPTAHVYGLTEEPIQDEAEADKRATRVVNRLSLVVGVLSETAQDEALLLEFAMGEEPVEDENEKAHLIAGASAVTETIILCQKMLEGILGRMSASYTFASKQEKERDGD